MFISYFGVVEQNLIYSPVRHPYKQKIGKEEKY